MIGDVELIYPLNGETKKVPIEAVFPTFVAIRWGMSGVYDIHLKDNIMIARSIRARRKGKCIWKVKDIDELRKRVAEHFSAVDKEQLDFSIAKHNETMPGKKINLECKCGHTKFIKLDDNRVKCEVCSTKYVGFKYR